MLLNKDKFTNVNNLIQRQQVNTTLQGPSLYTSQISTGAFLKHNVNKKEKKTSNNKPKKNSNTTNVSSSIKNSTTNVLKVPVLSNLSDADAKKLIDKELKEFGIKDNFENTNDENIFIKIYNNISYGLGKIFN
jgi:hypothetical protein